MIIGWMFAVNAVKSLIMILRQLSTIVFQIAEQQMVQMKIKRYVKSNYIFFRILVK